MCPLTPQCLEAGYATAGRYILSSSSLKENQMVAAEILLAYQYIS